MLQLSLLIYKEVHVHRQEDAVCQEVFLVPALTLFQCQAKTVLPGILLILASQGGISFTGQLCGVHDNGMGVLVKVFFMNTPVFLILNPMCFVLEMCYFYIIHHLEMIHVR